jgi:hypothetical protein
MTWKGCGKKRSSPDLKYCFGIYVRGRIKKTSELAGVRTGIWTRIAIIRSIYAKAATFGDSTCHIIISSVRLRTISKVMNHHVRIGNVMLNVWRSGGITPRILISPVGGSEWSSSRSCCFTPWKTAALLTLQAGLDSCSKPNSRA